MEQRKGRAQEIWQISEILEKKDNISNDASKMDFDEKAFWNILVSVTPHLYQKGNH